MNLEPNTLFDNRYRLIKMLGRGASAEVWLADDTLTGNLRVAIKIFSVHGDFDTYGAQDFQQEFSRVYNITHQNLLTPTNYSVCNNIPYLVLPYCENGSVNSMIGRCDEKETIKLIHDVASGLAHLHSHGVLHQDIKPDNIMVDDELNYLLSDFGISTGRNDVSGSYGGTRAYMSPERFTGTSDETGDIWALGASAYEMLTGNPPYGDHGGLLQTQGEAIEPITNTPVSPQLFKLLKSMMDPVPSKRPTAADVARITGHYLSTGSWRVRREASPVMVVAIVVAALAIVGGIWFWSHNRVKTYYYKDYTEVNGAPVGIGRLTGSEMRHRTRSYRFEVKGGKVRRVSVVNSKGKVAGFLDGMNNNVRFPDQTYNYREGLVDYMVAKNEFGKVMYKLEYDEKMNTGSFYYDDGKHTRKFFSIGSDNSVDDAEDIYKERSNIHTLLLSRDDKGRWKEIKYLSHSNSPLPNIEGVYGQRYEYDDNDRVVAVTYIDAEGNPIANHNGLGVMRMEYDNDNNVTQIAYFAPDGKTPSRSPKNYHMAKMEYDKYGNVTSERYYNAAGKPSPESEYGACGYDNVIEDGLLTRLTAVDQKGNPTYVNGGFSAFALEYDDNGFISHHMYLDTDGQPVMSKVGDVNVAGFKLKNNDDGKVIERITIDEDGEPLTTREGYAISRMEYNEVGDMTKISYYSADGKPVGNNGYEYSSTMTYDDMGRLTDMEFFDAEGKPATDNECIAHYKLEYSPYGAITRFERLGVDGKAANMRNNVSTNIYLYDKDNGYITEMQQLDKNGRLVEANGYARIVYGYDPKTNYRNVCQLYSSADKLTSTQHTEIDPATGLVSTEWEVGPTGALMPGTVKVHYVYDSQGRMTGMYGTDLNGNRIPGITVDNQAQKTVCESRMELDDNGNPLTVTFLGADGKPTTTNTGVHRYIKKFDELNRQIYENAQDISGNLPRGQREGSLKYDSRGNVVEIIYYDGKGNNGEFEGIHRRVWAYDRRNNQVLEESYNKEGHLADMGGNGFPKIQCEYNEYNNLTLQVAYDKSNKVVLKAAFEYNDKQNLTKVTFLDAAGKPSDWQGVAMIVHEYDEDGLKLLRTKYLDRQKQVLQTVNAETGAVSGGGSSSNEAPAQSNTSAAWMSDIKSLADDCPYEIGEGQILRSITYDASNITMTFKWQNDNASYSDNQEFASAMAQGLHQNGVPRNVSVRIRILNYNNNVIFDKTY